MKFMAIHYGSNREKEQNAVRVTQGRFLRKLGYIVGMDRQFTDVKTAVDILAAIRELRAKGMTDHWIWTGQCQKIARAPKAYGQLKNYQYPVFKELLPNGAERYIPARRYAFFLINGYNPLSHEIIKNVCDEPLCVCPHEAHNIVTTRDGWRIDAAEAASKQLITSHKSGEQLLKEQHRAKGQRVIVPEPNLPPKDNNLPDEGSTPTSELEIMTVFAEEWNEAGGTPFIGETPKAGKVPTEEEFLAKFDKEKP